MITGVIKTVIQNDCKIKGCYHCDHCKNTGFSWVCGLTGEKLEGFDTKEDKINNNKENFLCRNILVGVGHKCPLTIITEERTNIKFIPTIDELVDFIDELDVCGNIIIDDDEDDELRVSVQWINSGWEDDNYHREFVLDELNRIITKVEKKFTIKTEEGRCDDECEEIIITF